MKVQNWRGVASKIVRKRLPVNDFSCCCAVESARQIECWQQEFCRCFCLSVADGKHVTLTPSVGEAAIRPITVAGAEYPRQTVASRIHDPGLSMRILQLCHRTARAFVLGAFLHATAVFADPSAAQPPFRVNFEIDMREEIRAGRFDPATDRIGVRGAAAPLSWGSTVTAVPVAQGRFAATVVFAKAPRGEQPLQYKFKIDRAGQGPSDGWEDGPNRVMQLRTPTQDVARAFNAQPEPFPLERTGRIESIPPMRSRFVESRAVQVWLPPGYETDASRRYPVLYLHDGQAMFDAAFAGAEWRFDETAQRLSELGAITPPIIVAIESTRQRIDEYTPTSMMMPAARTGLGKDRRMGGGAEKYARFLVDELKPEIDRRFRTLRDAPNTAVGGSSLAGLLSMWLLMHHGDTFGAGLVVSPSIWWDDRFIIRDVAAAQGTGSRRPRIWLDIGTEEGKEALPLMRQLRDTLHGRGWGNETLAYLEEPEGTHDEASWALRVERMLRFLYGKPPA